MIFLLISVSLTSLPAIGEGDALFLSTGGERVTMSSDDLSADISLSDGTISVADARGNGILSVAFPSLSTFDSPISKDFSTNLAQYTSLLASNSWGLISAEKLSNAEYGEYIEVIVGVSIDLELPEIPDIPGGNPYIPGDLPDMIPGWANMEVRYLLTEKNTTIQSPGGNSYDLAGGRQLKMDIRLIMDDRYTPESVCVEQRLVIANGSHQLSLQTPGGDLKVSGVGDGNAIAVEGTDGEPSFSLEAPGDVELGRFDWAGQFERDGAVAEVIDFYAPTANGLSLYFCYNIPQGADEIFHDPSILLEPEALTTALPLPPSSTDEGSNMVIFLSLGLIIGSAVTVASVVRVHRGRDPMDLEENYYYKK